MRARTVVVASMVLSVLATYIAAVETRPTPQDIVAFAVLAAAASASHEAVHYLVARGLGRSARIEFYPRLLSIVLVYEEMSWSDYIKVALSAPIAVQACLAIPLALTGSPALYMANIYHAFASAMDIVGAATVWARYRGAVLRMEKRAGRYVVIVLRGGEREEVNP